MYRVAFLLIPEFSMISVISAVETLRVANSLLDEPAYQWLFVTDTAASVPASSGMPLQTDLTLKDLKDFDLLLVCGSFKPHKYENPATQSCLRRFARHGKALGSLESGAYHLAMAGHFDGHTATAHFSSLPTFAKMFPKVNFVPRVFTFAERRMSCAGGLAAVDLMLHLVKHQLGSHVSLRVASLIHAAYVREPEDLQCDTMTIAANQLSVQVRNACRIMEQTIGAPIRVSELAERVRISRRQLDRLFRDAFGCTAADFYMMLRLSRARKLVRSSALDLATIGESCGFGGYAHFSRSYRRLFSRSPSEERKGPVDHRVEALRLKPVLDLHPFQNQLDPQRLL